MSEIKKESVYSKLMSTFSLVLSVIVLVFAFIGMIQELPNSISNETILLFIIGFGIIMVNKV